MVARHVDLPRPDGVKLNARTTVKSLIEDGMRKKKVVLSVGEDAINKAVEMVKERVVN